MSLGVGPRLRRVPRIHLLCTPVNRGKEKGRVLDYPDLQLVLSIALLSVMPGSRS